MNMQAIAHVTVFPAGKCGKFFKLRLIPLLAPYFANVSQNSPTELNEIQQIRCSTTHILMHGVSHNSYITTLGVAVVRLTVAPHCATFFRQLTAAAAILRFKFTLILAGESLQSDSQPA